MFLSRRKNSKVRRLAPEPLETRLALAAQLLTTEIMPLHASSLADEDGDFSDWIEIHNSGDAAADLGGYFLTDNFGNLEKWTFPSVSIAPGDFLVVFASNKDRANPAGPL